MKALLLGLALALPSPLLAQEGETVLSLMPAAATGISHGYALWSTEQMPNPYGCLYGEATPERVIIEGAGFIGSPAECVAAGGLGYLVMVHTPLTQDEVCSIARKVRAEFPQLIMVGLVHGLEVRQEQKGLDYTSPKATWCATPLEPQSNPDSTEHRPQRPAGDLIPPRQA